MRKGSSTSETPDMVNKDLPAFFGLLSEEESGAQQQTEETVKDLEQTVQRFSGLLEQMKSGGCDLPVTDQIAVGISASLSVAIRREAARWDAGQGGEAAPNSAHIPGSDYIAPLGVDSRVVIYVADSKQERGFLQGCVSSLLCW